MSIYTYNGAEFSEEDVIAKAKEKGMDLNSYINKFGIEKVDDGPGKKKPVVVGDATVAGTKNTASKSAKSSSASSNNPFGKVNIFDPLNITKNALDAAQAKPAKDVKFDPKKFAKDMSTNKADGFYTKGENFEKLTGVKQKKEEEKIANKVFDTFDSFNYSKLSPEQKLLLDDQAANLLQSNIKPGDPYSLSSKDIELKSQEILSKAADKKKDIEDSSYLDRFVNGIAAGANYVGESFASMPETVYRAFALPQNIIASVTDNKDLEASPEKFKQLTGTTNPVMDYFVEEQKKIQKNNNIYDNANYDSASISENLEKGNWSDAFKLLGTGLAESAPVSISIMAGGANMGLAKLAATSTALMAGPETRKMIEENPNQSELENVVTGFGMAGAESVFSAIGEGSLGKVLKEIVKKEGAEIGAKTFRDGLITVYETALKKYGAPAAMVGEGLEEVATTITQNLISKKPAFQNVTDSFIAGVGGGGVWGSPVNLQKGIQGFKKGLTTYKINQQLKNTELNNLSEVFNPATPVTDAQINIATIPNSYKILNDQVDFDVNSDKITAEEGESIKKEFAFTYHANNKLKELNLPVVDNIEVINLLKQRDKLTSTIKAVNDPTLTSFQGEEVKAINAKISEITAQAAKQNITADIEKTKRAADAIGVSEYIEIPDLNNASDVREYLINNADYLDEKTLNLIETSYGAFVPLKNGKEALIINKEEAALDRVVTTGQHEFLHKIIYKAVKDNVELQKKIGSELYSHLENYIGEDQFKSTEFKKRYDGYKFSFEESKKELNGKLNKAKDYLAKGSINQETYDKAVLDAERAMAKAEGKYLEETLPLLSESLSKGDIKYNETFFTKIGDILRKIFQKYGLTNVSFDNGKDVFNFVRDYNKSFESGKFTKAFKTLANEGQYKGSIAKTQPSVKVNPAADVKQSQSISQVETLKNQLSELEDNEFDYEPEDFDQQVANLQEKIKRATEKEKNEPKVEIKKEKPTSEEDDVKEIIRENKASVASDKVQKIYDTKGKEGAQDIINLFKPITKKIVDKRRDAPGFDRELLTDEIETGVGGILDLITKYNPESGIPLAAYINKYLPVRAIATSKRLLGKEFSKDVAEEKSLIAEETISETKEKPKYANALESKVFEPEVLEAINRKILSVIRTLKSKIDEPVSINRTITPLISEIKEEIGKQVDINVKTEMGGKKDNQLKKWLLKNKKYILENMTTTWLMGKGKANKVEGGIPNAIQKSVDGKWLSYPDWVGKKIDRESVSTDQAGRTSGAELVRRLPNVANNVSNEDFLSNILEPSGNPIRGRKESLAKAIAEEMAFDIILKDFQEDGPIFEAFSANQERQGVEVKEVIKTDFLRQSERGNIKFSLSPKAKEEFNESVDKIFDAISIKGRITKAKLRRIVNNVFPEWTQDDKDEVVNKFGTYIRSAIQTIGKKYREKEKIKGAKVKDAIRAFTDNVDDGVAIGIRLGVPSVTANLKNSEHIKELQDINIDFGQQLLKDVGQREGLELLASFWYPSVAGRTKDESKSIFKGKGSFRQFLQDIQDGFDNKIKFEDLNIDRKNNAVTEAMVDGNISAKSKANDLRISSNAWDFTNRAVEFFAKEVKDPNNGYSNKHLASLLTLLIYERNSALRSAAPVAGAIVDPRIKNIKKYDYDHSVPARYVLSRLMDKYIDGKDIDLNKLKKDYVVTVIPLTMTESLKNAGLQSMMPYDYKDGDGADSRLQYGNKDISRMIKFSLSTKANLKWENKLGVTSADFKIGPYTYNIKAASIKDYGLSSDPAYAGVFEKIANNLDIPVEQITNNKKFDWVSFTEKSQGTGILNLGNSFKVFGIVTNGLIDYIKKNDLQGIAFDANRTEPSRVRLYNTMARVISNNFGWDYTSFDTNNKESGVIFAINSSKSNSFENQSEIQREKIKFSKAISPTFNKIIEENKGVEDYKNFSDIVARRRGAGKNMFDVYVPASAADFELLLYNFLGKGKKGEEQKKFFDDTLLKPYANGSDLMDAARQSIKNEYKQLLKEFPDVAKKIEKRTPDGDFTYDQAIRVAMWNDEGVEIPGLSQRDMNKLTDLVNSDIELKAFKDALIVTGRQGRGWIKPEEYWDANTIITDLHNLTEGEGRKKFLSEFIANAEEMFGKWENGKLVGPNINKVEAVYGTDVREALEDVLYRMTTGKNRGFGKDKETSRWADWVTGSTGAIMFLNIRSAALQLIGAVNFLNLRDNNPYAAAKAFANQKQYWEDFAYIWNSDKMKERRGGLKEDVAAAEIANAAAGSKNKVGAVLSYLLKIGYTPTQFADSFAIASGGAPFYRNRINTYLKEGMNEKDAEEAAWDDFTKVSDETQQSGDPRDISKQQASAAGRLLLTFQNTAMQQSRIVKKAFLDLKNGRGDAKTNFAKIAYYIAIQNTMFAVLQQGLFAVAFGDDDEDEEKPEKEKKLNEKLFDVADGVVDTILRGTGFAGGIVATVKNMAKKFLDEKDKGFKGDYAKVAIEGANLSPPIGSKLRKLYNGLQQTKFDKDLIDARGWDVMQDGRVNIGPMYGVTGKIVEAGTNIPMDRLVTKINNASEALNSKNTAMQRIMVGLGWSPYSAGIEESAGDKKIREEAKAKRKIEGVEKAKETRERTRDSIRQLPVSERLRLRKEAALERREKRKRRKMG